MSVDGNFPQLRGAISGWTDHSSVNLGPASIDRFAAKPLGLPSGTGPLVADFAARIKREIRRGTTAGIALSLRAEFG
jgi:hypothetical protein